jgi:hypothetical protein
MDANAHDSRGLRRSELRRHIAAIEGILRREEEYLARIPENLQGGCRHEEAEYSVEQLMCALDELRDAYPGL